MIIPIRCFTCGKVLADKWIAYDEKCKKKDDEQGKTDGIEGLDTAFNRCRGRILDELDIKKICCRRHMLGHVDLQD